MAKFYFLSHFFTLILRIFFEFLKVFWLSLSELHKLKLIPNILRDIFCQKLLQAIKILIELNPFLTLFYAGPIGVIFSLLV